MKMMTGVLKWIRQICCMATMIVNVSNPLVQLCALPIMPGQLQVRWLYDLPVFFRNGLESWKKKVLKSADLSVLAYHGGFRTKCPGDFTRYNVVHTTYSIVTNEVPKQHMADDDDEGEQKSLDKYGLPSEFSSKKKRRQTSSGQNKVKKRGKISKDSHLDVDSGPLARVRWFRVIY